MTTDVSTWSRRWFLQAVGGAALSLSQIAAVPELLRGAGLARPAGAGPATGVLETFDGLAALVWPGDDEFSVAQGEAVDGPGAVAAGAGAAIAAALDIFVPAPDGSGLANDDTVPLADAIAGAIDSVALTVDPVGAGATFASPFARLSYADKIETWRILEEESQAIDASAFPEPFHASAGVVQFVFGVLPGFVQFFGFSEISGGFDPATGRLARRPIGWDHARYLPNAGTTPPQGHADLRGYYAGRRQAEPTSRGGRA